MRPLFQFAFLLLFCGALTAQQLEIVDFKTAKADISLKDHDSKMVEGTISYQFEILKDVDSIFIDAQSFAEINSILNDSLNDAVYDGSKLIVRFPFKSNTKHVLRIVWKAHPNKALYFVGDQIWTQGQGKFTSHWLPSIDDVNEKIEFDLSITYKYDHEVLANGKLIGKEISGDYTKWHYNMQKPMSSYLVALAIGNYNKKTEISESGIPLEYYYYPEDSLKVEPTYRYTKKMFDFLEKEIGVAYPWQNYKQVPVKDFLYSGMENTSLTIFSDSFVIDSIGFNDKNYITVNAHELAHQWFGNYVTATSDEHHWLQEGFATYYALLAEKNSLGEDHYYWQLFKNAQELIAQEEAGESTSLLNPKSSSTTFYKKGAWALHVLREQVGDSAFKQAVAMYLEKHQFGNVKTNDFISVVENNSGQDLTRFVNEWLFKVKLPEDAMVKSLKKSKFMREYFSVNCEEYSEKCKDHLVSNISDEAKIKVVSQIKNKINMEAFQNNLQVRQAISQYVSEIPSALKTNYESLLTDKSYITIENALYHLWVNFPQDHIKYLQQTKDIIGFNDYNVKLLWLALHLNTVEYQPEKKQAILDELIAYSLPGGHFELRMNAFKYLKLVGGFEAKAIASLLGAETHHNWRFAKFAKTLISELEKEESLAIIISELRTKNKY